MSIMASERPYGITRKEIEESRERLRRNVERGVKLLDEKIPDWRDKITRHISMNICAECIIGQIYNIPQGDNGWVKFGEALAELGIDPFGDTFGFDIENPHVDSYGDLEDIWEEFIRGGVERSS